LVDVRAWLVDLDGTLYNAKLVKMAMAGDLVTRGLDVISVIREFRKTHERLRVQLCDPVENAFAVQMELTAAACSIEPGRLEVIVREWMIRRPSKWIRRFARRKLLHEIAAFRSVGGLAAIVSDYPAKEKLEALGATELFDVVVANGESLGPGRLKPWPDGYLAAAEHLGAAPSECLVIGDRRDLDGEAARRAGMSFRLIA